MCVCVCVLVTQACPTLCTMNCHPPGCSVHQISQSRILEWVAISSFRGFNRGYLPCRQILYSLSHQGSGIFRVPHLYPFIYQWTFRLLLYVGKFLICVLCNILYHHYYFIVIGTLNSRDFIPYLWHNALHKTGHTMTSPSILMTK